MIANRIITNTAFNAVGRVWLILVNFLLTPLILSYLGDQRFALWALFWTFSTWFSFMDLGVGVSVVREVARLAEEESVKELNTTLFSALAFNFLMGLLILLVAWSIADGLVTMMHVRDALRSDALAVAYLGPLVFMLMGLMGIFDCFLRGMQRYDLIVIVSISASLINVLTVWSVLHFGYGILGLMIAVTLVYLVQLAILVGFSVHVFPKLAFRPAYISVKRIRQMLPFGLHLQTAQLAELASYQADKIILAVLTPLYFVTTYDLGAKVASLLRQIPYLLTSAIFPVISQLHANGDTVRLWMIYERGSKYLWMVSTPLFVGLCITAPFVIQLWLGYVSPDVYYAVIVLSFGFWSTVNVSVAYNVGTGMGWSKPVMYISLIQAVSNLLLSWLLASSLGYVGVLYATSMTLMVTSGLVYLRFCRDFNRARRLDVNLFMRVLWANLAPAVACLAYLYFGGHWGVPESRVAAIAPLLICVGTYMLLYLIAIRIIGLLDSSDLEWLGGYCPVILRKYLFVK
ncbi:MAG: oligosaccharide flippase family protein [Mariprofundales bacterium]|nr:oligosaccharide flippase family protein [Mariprofundales bacterium]